MDKHDTIGQDCVAMCVNDIACSEVQSRCSSLTISQSVRMFRKRLHKSLKGVADGCVLSGCALVGGETAEHPGMMPEDEYDVAGF